MEYDVSFVFTSDADTPENAVREAFAMMRHYAGKGPESDMVARVKDEAGQDFGEITVQAAYA